MDIWLALQVLLIVTVLGSALYITDVLSRFWTKRNDPRVKSKVFDRTIIPHAIILAVLLGVEIVTRPPVNFHGITQLVLAVGFGMALGPALMKLSGNARIEFVK